MRDMNKQSYIKACDELIKIVNQSGIGSLYQYGSVRHPGISDLDLIVCNNKPLDRDVFNYFSEKLKSVSRETKDIIGHASIISMPSNTFENVNIFDRVDLRLLSGHKFNIRDYPDGKNFPISYIRLADWSVERLALVNRLSRELNGHTIRYLMCVLNSVGITLKNYAIFSGELSWGEEYIDQVRLIRDKYVEGDRDCANRLVGAMLKLGREFLSEVVLKLADHQYAQKIEDIMKDFNVQIKVSLKGRDSIIYVHGNSVNLKGGVVKIPIALAHQWMYIRELVKSKNGSKNVSLDCKSVEEYKLAVARTTRKFTI